jgi:hypothetical protein
MTSNANSDSKLPVNYVFVDYQNVHELDVTLIGKKTVYLTLLLGPNCRLDGAVVEQLLNHAASVQLVRLTSHGKDALDFTLSFYLGKTANADPTAYFHIVSKDAGFDPLIAHLETRRIRVKRHNDYSSLTFTSPPKASLLPTEEQVRHALMRLQQSPSARPTSKKALANWLRSNFGASASDAQRHELLDRLCKTGQVIIGENEAVTYSFDP